MTIDKEQLISLLKEKTGLERDQVEGQLSQLIEKIQKAAEEGKAFEIEGFGTFNMTEDGLQFMPADKLETEINNKYAGMKPIELIGAFKEPESDKDIPNIYLEENNAEDLDADDKWEVDTEALGDEIEQEADGNGEESEPRESPPILSETTQEDLEQEESAGRENKTDGDIDSEEFSQESATEETHSVDKEANEESDDVLGTILVAAVVVLAVGVGGWLTYDLGFSNQGVATSSTTTDQSTTRPVGSDTNNNESEVSSKSVETNNNDSEPEQQMQVPNGDESEEPSQPEQELYGLFGEVNGDISSGYTIVVHSLRDQPVAEQNRRRLQEAGYRALINRAEIQGVTYYRVGLGQFKTVADAQQALSDIPEQYRGNNFIKRIQ